MNGSNQRMTCGVVVRLSSQETEVPVREAVCSGQLYTVCE